MSNVRILFWNVKNFKGRSVTAFRENFITAVINEVQPVVVAIVEGAETMEAAFSDLAADFGALLGDDWRAIGSDQSRMIYDVTSFPQTINDLYAAGLLNRISESEIRNNHILVEKDVKALVSSLSSGYNQINDPGKNGGFYLERKSLAELNNLTAIQKENLERTLVDTGLLSMKRREGYFVMVHCDNCDGTYGENFYKLFQTNVVVRPTINGLVTVDGKNHQVGFTNEASGFGLRAPFHLPLFRISNGTIDDAATPLVLYHAPFTSRPTQANPNAPRRTLEMVAQAGATVLKTARIETADANGTVGEVADGPAILAGDWNVSYRAGSRGRPNAILYGAMQRHGFTIRNTQATSLAGATSRCNSANSTAYYRSCYDNFIDKGMTANPCRRLDLIQDIFDAKQKPTYLTQLLLNHSVTSMRDAWRLYLEEVSDHVPILIDYQFPD